jgi:hypothetical protein
MWPRSSRGVVTEEDSAEFPRIRLRGLVAVDHDGREGDRILSRLWEESCDERSSVERVDTRGMGGGLLW